MSFIKRYNGAGIMSEIIVRQSELKKLREGGMDNIGFIVSVRSRLRQLQSTRAYYENYHSFEIIIKK